jgi:hypothetical protein
MRSSGPSGSPSCQSTPLFRSHGATLRLRFAGADEGQPATVESASSGLYSLLRLTCFFLDLVNAITPRQSCVGAGPGPAWPLCLLSPHLVQCCPHLEVDSYNSICYRCMRSCRQLLRSVEL